MGPNQPGQVITPQGDKGVSQPANAGAPPEPTRPPEAGPVQPQAAPAPTPPSEPVVSNNAAPNVAPVTTQAAQTVEPVAPPSPSVTVPAESTVATDWRYTPNSASTDTASQLAPLPEAFSWTAEEFIAHEKSMSWYAALIAAGVVLAVLDYILTRDYISTTVIIAATILFAVYASHKPRTLQYRLSPDGLQIGEKLYAFQEFKTFSVTEEGMLSSVVFMPLKRFMPPLTIYVTQDIEEKVQSYLSNFLPLEQRASDAVDSLMRRIRF